MGTLLAAPLIEPTSSIAINKLNLFSKIKGVFESKIDKDDKNSTDSLVYFNI